ncbi:MAG: helix-turn-helix transcriptional regulator [Lachnospiraceae bacterium]|nr:helix-turn-helix transcriptional regulator [Lachnospiraceae bacterium]MBR3600526.1 helix-turn-helix transcriptional regulator [Lachnospiraceae bacterium]
MYNEQFDVINRIKQLCKDKDLSFYRISKDSGIPQTTLTNMLNRGTTPSIYTLEKICETMDITLSQFFDIDQAPPASQQELLTLYMSLPKHKQEIALAYIKGLSES